MLREFLLRPEFIDGLKMKNNQPSLLRVNFPKNRTGKANKLIGSDQNWVNVELKDNEGASIG